jgi:hypothetical protein
VPTATSWPGHGARTPRNCWSIYIWALLDSTRRHWSFPDVEPTHADVESRGKGSPSWRELRDQLQADLGARDYYVEMFAPYELAGQEPVVGSLSDDLADIYADLIRGILAWEAGDPTAAVWAWGFHFGHHWGEHATGALRALHALRDGYEYGEPDLSERTI